MTLLEMPLKTMWSEVQQVRERMDALLTHLPEQLRVEVVMTVSELIENAIKYGQSVPGAPEATVRVVDHHDFVEVIVRNGVPAQDTIVDLRKHLDRIAAAPDRAALYIDRLRELMAAGGRGGSQLGLYRIACEAGFDLSCEYADRIVTLRATKRLG